VIILTGAASGIGRETAILLAKEGAKLVISDINEDGLNETLKLIEKEGKTAEKMKVDVSKPEDIKNMIEHTYKKYGKIDVLINNAGVVRVGPIDEFSDEDYDLLINVNLKGTYYGCKFIVPYFKKQGYGNIINLASVAAHIGQVNHACYCSTKAGVLAITKALALELAPYNIRVNSVSPGATDTPMLRSDVEKNARERGVSFDVVKKEFEEEGVMGRWAKPLEIAYGILFLASDESSYMTGADLRIDGGWTAK